MNRMEWNGRGGRGEGGEFIKLKKEEMLGHMAHIVHRHDVFGSHDL